MENCSLKLRVSAQLKDWISERAVQNSRSMNGEVLAILRGVEKEDATLQNQPQVP
jgi:hypothetical protein